MQKISNNIYAETNFPGCNPGFVVTTAGVVMIDTPQMPTDAIRWRKQIAGYGPVRYIINTEPHHDHFSGNYFYKGTIVSHEGTRQAILNHPLKPAKDRMKKTSPEDYKLMRRFHFRPPAITFTDELTLYVGKHTLRLIHLPGHTPYQAAVFIPEEKVIFTSDNIFNKVPIWLQQADPFQWLESLDKMAKLNADVFIPGHGEICGPPCITEMRARIRHWVEAVEDTIKKGMTLEEAQINFSFREDYPWDNDVAAMAPIVQRENITRLYNILKNRGNSKGLC